jgi:transcriptional regulator with XRE-family HTH domain
MTTTAFGKLLGVTHGQISRYELGQATPGYVPLGRLLQLAEGAEKNPILDRIADLLGKKRDEVTESTAIAELEKTGQYFEPLTNSLSFQERLPHFFRLMKVMNKFHSREREIDPALPHILELWLEYDDTDPAVRECFADAAKYLDVALAAKTGRMPSKST